MGYHIDTGLIKEKFKVDCECPLCEIQKVVEEQFLHEFLNDAVMEDNTRIKVGKLGFCARHFDMLFSRQNKLSVALQIGTRADKISEILTNVKNVSSAVKQGKFLEQSLSTCAICEYTEESMVKYYKTIAQMFERERDFYKTLVASKGFCLHHYAELLKYSKSAGFMAKSYVDVLSGVQVRNFERIKTDLKAFCDKHDYRRANEPLGSAETALPRTREKFYGKKID
jgi:predicted Zn-ribbon and HTH transcriptional regulator